MYHYLPMSLSTFFRWNERWDSSLQSSSIIRKQSSSRERGRGGWKDYHQWQQQQTREKKKVRLVRPDKNINLRVSKSGVLCAMMATGSTLDQPDLFIFLRIFYNAYKTRNKPFLSDVYCKCIILKCTNSVRIELPHFYNFSFFSGTAANRVKRRRSQSSSPSI